MKDKFDIQYSQWKKTSVKSLLVPIDLYRCKVQFVMPKESIKLTDKYEWDEVGCAATYNYLEQSGTVLIRFTEIDHNTISHEITHAVQIIMNWIGHNTCHNEADEPSAYLVGHITGEFYKKWKEYKKRK